MLSIKRLKLHNFMCVADADLSFDDGLNLIVGSNGQGKSTVLQAVALCLLGSKRSDTLKEYIQLGKTDAQVLLEASINGEPITITVNLDSKSSGMDRTAQVASREKPYKNSEVTELLESYDLKYYSDLLMSMQNEGDITKLTPAERAGYLQKLFQFSFKEKIQDLKDQVSSFKESISYQTNQIEFNTKSIEDRKKEIKEVDDLSFTDADINAVTETIKSLNAEISGLSDSLKEKDNLTTEKTNAMYQVNSIQSTINTYTRQIDSAKSSQAMIDSLNEKIAEYQASIESSNVELEKAKGLSDELKVKLDTANENKKTFTEQLTVENNNRTTASETVSKITGLLASSKSELAHATKHIEMIKIGTCPECGHKFDSSDEGKYQTALEEATNAVTTNTSDLEKANKNLSDINTRILGIQDTIQAKNTEISGINGEISTNSYKISSISNQIQTLNQSIESTQAQIKQYTDSINNVSELESKLAEANKNLVDTKNSILEIDNKLSEFSNVYDNYTAKTKELANQQEILNKYNSSIVQNNTILQNNENIRKSIAEMEVKIVESKNAVESYRRQKTTYDDAIVLLEKTFPAYLILKTCLMLEKEMNNFIQVIFPNMAVKLFQNKGGVEFFYTTNINNGRSLEKENMINAKMASGFEKAILSIAFKISLCRAYNLRFAFMDEIDQAGTEENSELLFKAILSNDLYDQLFVISHKPSVRDAMYGLAPNLKTYYVDKGVFTTEESN